MIDRIFKHRRKSFPQICNMAYLELKNKIQFKMLTCINTRNAFSFFGKRLTSGKLLRPYSLLTEALTRR